MINTFSFKLARFWGNVYKIALPIVKKKLLIGLTWFVYKILLKVRLTFDLIQNSND